MPVNIVKISLCPPPFCFSERLLGVSGWILRGFSGLERCRDRVRSSGGFVLRADCFGWRGLRRGVCGEFGRCGCLGIAGCGGCVAAGGGSFGRECAPGEGGRLSGRGWVPAVAVCKLPVRSLREGGAPGLSLGCPFAARAAGFRYGCVSVFRVSSIPGVPVHRSVRVFLCAWPSGWLASGGAVRCLSERRLSECRLPGAGRAEGRVSDLPGGLWAALSQGGGRRSGWGRCLYELI